VKSIFIGYDPREAVAFSVAHYSIRYFDRYTPIKGVMLSRLIEDGLHTRPMEETINGDGRRQLIDVLSKREGYDGAISTEHANARFFVPEMIRRMTRGWHAGGWALFCDCDVMFMASPEELFALADSSKALMCVHHNYRPAETVKMDGQRQTAYTRKNQSSVMLINCDHPANKALTLEMLNTLPGRDLHRFCWLDDDEIGELPLEWNYLVGVSKLSDGIEPKLVHFTRGLPDMAGYENQEYADEWRALVPRAVGAL
jgi:hypothetical protein